MFNEFIDSVNLIVFQTKLHTIFLIKIIALPWIIFFVNLLLNNKLLYFGIIPRKIYGLLGIIFAPVLHANFNHLFFNTIPLLILSDFILVNGIEYFLQATIFIILISGLLIWCFSKPGIYVGASALITGYWGLLITSCITQHTTVPIILGLLSIYYFLGIFFGIFPNNKTNSWQGHIFGLLSGIIFLIIYINPYKYY